MSSLTTLDPDAGRESSSEEAHRKVDGAALLDAALISFNVTEPDAVDEPEDIAEKCNPSKDSEEEILDELDGVSKGLRTVLEQPQFNPNYMREGQEAAAKVVTRLLRKRGYEATTLEEPQPGIRMTDLEGFLTEAQKLVIDWFAQVEENGAHLSLRTISEEVGDVRAIIDACLENR
ncbi:hypothetical protein HN748_05270 [Candidatus Peregrinibacteria bacterium]|jgi:hypothetical protein|nr:hypothetical protein [Candidatus Peregrinibacteria bacterium]MBT7484176.1 hypothetical protein [Candidatus Peregrinibacteria bacterium]MBT7703619.1 hypothetical protein [Candidatus Peregrinibacteria bacterium]